MSSYTAEYDAVVQTVHSYIDACKQGKSALLRSVFHPGASFLGYAGGDLVKGVPFLFDWVDKNGPAPDIQPRFASVDILDSIAVVRLEVENWSGNLAGSVVHMSDLFTLLRTPEGWKIILKAFHCEITGKLAGVGRAGVALNNALEDKSDDESSLQAQCRAAV